MGDSDYFAEQLRVTAEQFTWVARQIPEARRYAGMDGNWSAARAIYHMTSYERVAVLPSMRLWLGGPAVDDSELDDESAEWERVGQLIAYDDLLDAFNAVRAEQIALAAQLVGEWDKPRATVWTLPGAPPITLRWVVTKTLQHTFEHSSELLRIWLYADMRQAWHAARQRQTEE